MKPISDFAAPHAPINLIACKPDPSRSSTEHIMQQPPSACVLERAIPAAPAQIRTTQ